MDNNTVRVTDNQAFVRLLLDSACAQGGIDAHGIGVYYIETHCVGWWIEAYKKDGEWVVLSMRSEPC